MDQSVEVAPADGSVVAEWRGTEPLGLTLARDLRIEEVDPTIGKEKGLAVGLALQAVGEKRVVGFALDGVMAMIEKAKKPGQTLTLRFSPPSQQSVAEASDLSPLPKAGVSLPAGVDKSTIDFAALIKTGAAPVAVEVSQRDTFVRMADSGAPVTATFHQPGPLGIHFSDSLPLRVIKIGERSAAAATPLSVGMALQAVGGKNITELSHEEAIEAVRQAPRPLTLTFEPVTPVTPETAGAVNSCAVVGSKLVEASSFFGRSYTTYTIAALVDNGVFEIDMRYSDLYEFHEQWTTKLMAAALPVPLPEKNLSYAMKNTEDTVAARREGIQHFIECCFKLAARLESDVFTRALQEFLHGRPVAPASEAFCRNGWDVVGKYDYALPVEFFEAEYHVPHTLLLRGDKDRTATFTASGHPVHGGSISMRGSWKSALDGCALEVTFVEKELQDQNQVAVATTQFTLAKSENGFGMNIDDDCTVVGYVGAGGPAEKAGVPVGAVISAVNNLGVANKDEVVAQLVSAKGDAVSFTFKPPKETETSAVDIKLHLSKQLDESELWQIVGGKSIPNPFGIARRVLMCQAAVVDGVQSVAGSPLALSEHYFWPDALYCTGQMNI